MVQIKLMKFICILFLLVCTSVSIALVVTLQMDKNGFASIGTQHALCSVHVQRIHHELKVGEKIYIYSAVSVAFEIDRE